MPGHAVFAVLPAILLVGCTATEPVRGPADGPIVGRLEGAETPVSFAYQAKMLAMPECGFAIGVHPDWTVNREEVRLADGRRSVRVRVVPPASSSPARRRAFDHLLQEVTVEGAHRATLTCVESTVDPVTFAERGRRREAVAERRPMESTSGPQGQALIFFSDIAQPAHE